MLSHFLNLLVLCLHLPQVQVCLALSVSSTRKGPLKTLFLAFEILPLLVLLPWVCDIYELVIKICDKFAFLIRMTNITTLTQAHNNSDAIRVSDCLMEIALYNNYFCSLQMLDTVIAETKIIVL